ncbi:MAG: aminotransferase class V-fold PLP-dependent enzyme [Hyphomicrobium zavarzinii]|jgi:alanine-glyoxylate transaminase/serine-glyoxylate transaminase/serine-pyruvate transaminase|uniref:aminotransferase class V-fold PLP-dependent enzyme n=1 Tax=Hyphomicrobium TaxID=81 RepID=UPI00037142AD|nr:MULTISPECIES: aminotransferase class V-fold PLP-dependent enzyme [Hyphomicrobium]MBL8847167.1 aminotransferase class V-fold PLP-dependent enzyme [Hyphomicrobium zavarzinii]WBT37510.1 aminotransferase class V-fold PLP-dependent enzyme [Hyphomicrobium sp. DMF-1]
MTMVTPHLFIPGPTNVPDAVRMAMNIPMEDMRSPEFPKFTLPIFEDLKKVFKMKDGRVFIFPSSGTGAWESAITNTLAVGDKVLMSRFGQFSLLWVDMAERLGLKVVLCDEEWGTGVPLEKYADILAKDTAHEIKAVFATHNETATGVSSDIAGVRKALDAAKHPALLFVDGVSSVGSLDMRMGEWGVDACVSGSQKGFMLPTGLGILAVSQKALDANKSLNGRMNRCFFSWEDMIKTNDLGFFPYTPATQLIRGLRASLNLIFAEGIDNIVARHTRLASGVRAAVDAWGLKLCAKEPKWHSDTVSAIVVPEGIDANNVLKTAYYRYNTSLGTGLNKLNGRVFRIGHLGALDEGMIGSALFNVEMTLKDCGVPIKFGSGTGAAAEYFSKTATKPALSKAA